MTTGKVKRAARVTTFRLAPGTDQWAIVRAASQDAARYCNKHAQARLGNALKWRVPAEYAARPPKQFTRRAAGDKAAIDKLIEFDLVKLVREQSKGDLGSATYLGCEMLVKSAWQRDGRKVMGGAPLPQWNDGNALAISGHSERKNSGIQIVRAGEWYAARCQLFRADHPDGNWHVIPLHAGKGNDRKRELLEAMCEGSVPMKLARILVKRRSGKMLLQVTHMVDKAVCAPGERHAALTNWDQGPEKVERLLLRVVIGTDGTGRRDNQHKDYSARLKHLKTMRDDESGIRRRIFTSRGRSRYHARDKRRFIDRAGFDDWQKTYLHQWSREIVDWLVSQGAGTLTIGLVGGDWPAHMLGQQVRYKAEAAGIKVVEPRPDDPATDKAAKAAIKKQQGKARKLRDALRTVGNHLGA